MTEAALKVLVVAGGQAKMAGGGVLKIPVGGDVVELGAGKDVLTGVLNGAPNTLLVGADDVAALTALTKAGTITLAEESVPKKILPCTR